MSRAAGQAVVRFTTEIPKAGDRRLRRGFLFFPLTLHTRNANRRQVKETRWLEFAAWVEVRCNGKMGDYWRVAKWVK
jgi:hypothetical protein